MSRRIAPRFIVPLALAFGFFADVSPALAFRTARELPELHSASAVKFDASPISFRMRRSFPLTLRDTDVEAALWSAAAAWGDPSCSSAAMNFIGFVDEPAAHGDGVNTVEFVADWSARGFDPTAAGFTDVQFARVDGGPWSISEADVYLNASFLWSTKDDAEPPARSLRSVLTHEFGHFLGLLHPCELDSAPLCSASDEPTVTMYPLYSPAQSTLAADDIAGICYLYPAPTCIDTGCPDGHVCQEGECREICGDEICEKGTLCTQQGCKVPSPCLDASCIGRECMADAECSEFEACVAGRCARGTLDEDQLCSTSTDCATGVCAEGTCHKLCASAADCARPKECAPWEGERSICMAQGAPLGATCQSPLDCSGVRCLEHASPNPLCTNPCGDHYPECPVGWTCGVVEAENVCIPVHVKGGCSVQSAGATPGSRAGWTAALTTALVALCTRTQRRRRKPAPLS